jgi:hypothetical protein
MRSNPCCGVTATIRAKVFGIKRLYFSNTLILQIKLKIYCYFTKFYIVEKTATPNFEFQILDYELLLLDFRF